MKEDNSMLWNQFCRLGEMMGDGLHYEDDGKWIPKEYRRLSKILMPDMHKEMRDKKSEAIDAQMKDLLERKKCECGSQLKQTRKGAKTCQCVNCGKRYKASSPTCPVVPVLF